MIDFDGIDLDLLVALDVLLDEANVTRAATRLGLGQPAVSARLARLRRFFADPLLVPSENGRGMIATPRAAALHEPLKQALLGLASAVRPPEAFDPARLDRRFVIAAGDNAVVSLGPPLAEAIAAAAPNLRLAFVQPRAETIAGDLERGDVDLLIGSERVVPPGAVAVALRREDFVAVRRKDHPSRAMPFDLDAYCAFDHVLVSPSGSLRGYVDEVLERLGRRRRVVLAVHQFSQAAALVAHGDRVSTLPRRFAETRRGEVDLLELPFAMPGYTLHLAWHPRDQADPAHVWLRRLLRRLARDHEPAAPLPSAIPGEIADEGGGDGEA